MWCLWNGEYGEHEINDFSEKHLKYMDEQHQKWVGHVVGDFTVLKVEYDWGRRDQRWTIKCNLCGRELYQYHVADWRRGKGRSLECKCRKEAKQAEKEAKKESRPALASQKISENQKRVGEIYGGWKIVESIGGTRCIIECITCGKRKSDKIRTQDVIDLKISPCNHKKPIDYSGDEWIGKRNGHLTATGRDGSLFICKCDCGNELTVRPVELFTRKTKKVCGEPDCQYSSVVHRIRQAHKKEGIAYEREIENMLIERGYNAKATKGVGDFGVDIIITNDDGSKTAIQCKKQDSPAGVGAIQEVYAGGRFYDCTKFAVICEKGFSNPAILMAKKLGIYLCEGEFNMPNDISEYAAELLPVHHTNEKSKKLYELYGVKKSLADWCIAFDTDLWWVRKQLHDGVSLSLALTTPKKEKPQFTVNDFTGTLSEICNHFEVLQPTIEYRMKQKGMTLEEAIFTPKITKGRPSTN